MTHDHIIPKSFCRKLGLTPEQANHPKNLRYLLPKDNVDKFSYIYLEEELHLEIMCKEWGIEYPSRELIEQHNYDAAKLDGNLKNNKI